MKPKKAAFILIISLFLAGAENLVRLVFDKKSAIGRTMNFFFPEDSTTEATNGFTQSHAESFGFSLFAFCTFGHLSSERKASTC